MKQTIRDILDEQRDYERRDDSFPGARSVLNGTATVGEASRQDALRRPLDRNQTYLRRGDKLDPVLAYHLRRSHL